MKAIILIAGEGKRLRSLTDEPKCFLKINGKTILENALDCLSREHFREVVLVTGYREDYVRKIGKEFNGMKITYVNNPFFKSTNNMYSLYLAREHLSEGAVCFDGDVIFEEKILQCIMKHKENCWAVDRNKDLEGSVLTADKSGKLVNVEIIRHKIVCSDKFKSVAIIKISPELGLKLQSWLEEDVTQGNTNIYIDLVLGKRLKESNIHICDVSGFKWFEIDTEEDYMSAKALFNNSFLNSS